MQQRLIQKENNIEEIDFNSLFAGAAPVFQILLWILGIYVLWGSVDLYFTAKEMALPFFGMGAAGWACIAFWKGQQQGRFGAPMLVIFTFPVILLNTIPLLSENPTVMRVEENTIFDSAVEVAIFLACLGIGLRLGKRTISKRSRWNLLTKKRSQTGDYGMALSLFLLVVATLVQISAAAGLIYRILGNAASFMPVITAFAGAASTLGAFLGGLSIARQPFRPIALVFWTTFAINFVFSISGLILFSASLTLVACAFGIGLRLNRVPWAYLLVVIGIITFLNQGKFVMRNRYWEETGQQQIAISELPTLYSNWIEASWLLLVTDSSDFRESDDPKEQAGKQTLLTRLDSFQNVTFIVNSLEKEGVEPLGGKTYTLIPELFIPRFLWPEKPRTHAGQILLNVHFGRQASVEDTETTYVAWGLLPEGIGNFGRFWGAVLVGLVIGASCGWLESWSSKKYLFSVEGLIVIALMCQAAVASDSVASLLLTSLFQMVIAIIAFGYFMVPKSSR